MQVGSYNVNRKRNLHIHISAQHASCQEERENLSGKESALRASYHSIKGDCDNLQESCNLLLTMRARCGMIMLQEVARTTSRREAKVMAEEYVLARTPDLLRLGELVTRAKGPSRTMAQFAEDCGIGASTLSRIANGKITKAVSLENLQAIYDHRDESVDLSFDTLVHADGYLPKDVFESFRAHNSIREKSVNDQRCVQNTIIASFLDRNIGIQKLPTLPALIEVKYPYSRPSLSFLLKTQDTEKRWDFYLMLARVEEDGENRNRMVNKRVMINRMVERFSGVLLMDAWYPNLLENVRTTAIFVDRILFDSFVDVYKGSPINTEITAMLIDTERCEIIKEEWLSSKPSIPSLLDTIPIDVSMVGENETDFEEDKPW